MKHLDFTGHKSVAQRLKARLNREIEAQKRLELIQLKADKEREREEVGAL